MTHLVASPLHKDYDLTISISGKQSYRIQYQQNIFILKLFIKNGSFKRYLLNNNPLNLTKIRRIFILKSWNTIADLAKDKSKVTQLQRYSLY